MYYKSYFLMVNDGLKYEMELFAKIYLVLVLSCQGLAACLGIMVSSSFFV